MPIVVIVILVVLALVLVPFIKRAEQNKAMETAFLEAWSKELGKKKEPKFFDVIGWLLISSVAIMLVAITIGAVGGL